ncbi:uncharacterized protein LOC112350514 [Selaginella moellendorffii]|uniref:uncharacterized protein LOC112350514 n=1 Tax=Selaginella moellendorffii TaxID=88036 RepID=UPI000D1C297E|nr:uncharacterized protein LOC112350514 [Selaginella moellendorffii]|eukprot:XP_024542612.1 uncharacterized protein LOC112350514 [Selaginella moellendorffii]
MVATATASTLDLVSLRMRESATRIYEVLSRASEGGHSWSHGGGGASGFSIPRRGARRRQEQEAQARCRSGGDGCGGAVAGGDGRLWTRASSCLDEGDSRPVYGKPSYDSVIAGKVSGRKWKEVKTCRASALWVSVEGSSLEERAKAKRIAAEFRERKQQLKEQIRANKVDKRKRLEEYKKRKEENVKKSGLKLQKVTNLKKLQKMSKREKKKLVAQHGN